MMKYVDTSAFVKVYSKKNETGDHRMRNLLISAKNGEIKLTSSILTIGESVSALDKWLRRKDLTVEEFNQITAIFFQDIKDLKENGQLNFEELNSEYLLSSIPIIVKHHLTINDAIHLFSAINLEVSEFISSDKTLNRAALEEGLRVVDPEV